MSKDNKRLFQTIFISGISTVFSYLINFLLTPYISNHVGIESCVSRPGWYDQQICWVP